MTVTQTRYRYRININLKADAFEITDVVYGLPCGLPDGDGVIQTLRFAESSAAQDWLTLCASVGLEMTYDQTASVETIAANQVGIRAADVGVGFFVYDKTRSTWAPVTGRSRSDTAMHFFVGNGGDPITFGFDEIVQVCHPLSAHQQRRR